MLMDVTKFYAGCHLPQVRNPPPLAVLGTAVGGYSKEFGTKYSEDGYGGLGM